MTTRAKPIVRLSPPLDWIRREHLGLSDELIAAVQAGRVSAEISQAARAHTDWATYTEEPTEPDDGPRPEASAEVSLPPAILDAIKRKADAVSAQFDSLPQPGQIVRVSQIKTSTGQHIEAFLGASLYVLLDAPYPEDAAVWAGWLVAGETDYASYWDFLLQETDQPFMPAAAMVQVWNPVHLYLPMAERVVAQLRPERLQAVRALTAEFLSGTDNIPAGVDEYPGQILVRNTLSSLRVVTGTPIRTEHDPRREYQAIMVEAAEALRQPARMALRQHTVAAEHGLNVVWQKLVQHWRALWNDFTTTPAIAVPMSAGPMSASQMRAVPMRWHPDENMGLATSPKESYLTWPNRMQLRLIVHDVDAAIVTVELLALSHPLTAELFQDGTLIDSARMKSA